MLKRLSLACLVFFSFSLSAFAQDASSQLTSLLQNLQTMQGNYDQTVQDNNGNTMQQSQGKMALQRPGLFRWETLQPNQQLIVADGKTIWIYDKDLQQVSKQRQSATTNSPGLLLSDSTDHLANRFTVRALSSDNGLIGFKLSPKGKRDLFRTVELYFNNDILQQMIIHDNFGQTTTIQFSQIKINNTLSKSLFTFSPPKDVDVVTG